MYIGVDIGGTKCSVSYGDDCGKVITKTKFSTTNCQQTVARIVEEAKKYPDAQAVGISCGGPLDSRRGLIQAPPNLPGWDNIPIVKILQEELGIPTYLQNDANACALAEWRLGAGRGTENMIFLTFGTGLGAGLILNGRIYEGSNGNAGEVGHIRLSDYGPVGFGKMGAFEGFCSGSGLAQLGQMIAREKLQIGQNVSFCKSMEDLENITAKSIADCAYRGNEDAKEVFRICGRQLGKGLSVLVDILNPERIVLGSIYQRCEDLLIKSMEEVMQREALGISLAVCDVVPAMLGDDIGDYAALAVALEGEKQNAKCFA